MKKIKLFLSFITLVTLSLFVLTGCFDAKSSSGKTSKAPKGKIKALIKKAEKNNVDAMVKVADSYYYCNGVEGDLKEAFKWYSKAAEAGDPYAMFKLGTLYKNGEGVKSDYIQGEKLQKKAADAGYLDAMIEVWGENLYETPSDKLDRVINAIEGKDTQDKPKTRLSREQLGNKIFEAASKSKGNDKNYYLGMCYFHGIGTEKDEEKALKLMNTAAKKGSTKAYNFFSDYYYKKDNQQALKFAEKYAKKTGAVGWYFLASLKSTIETDKRNRGLSEDDLILNIDDEIEKTRDPIYKAELIKLKNETKKYRAQLLKKRAKEIKTNNYSEDYALAVKSGFAPAMVELAYIEDKKGNITHKFELYTEAYKKGCERANYYLKGDDYLEYLASIADKDKEAQYLLGKLMLEDGRDQNFEKGFKLVSQAYANGVSDAVYELADCYYYGKGTQEDKAKAFTFYSEAAKGGNDEAQYMLGEYYMNAYGNVAEDPKLAFEWFSKASEQGHSKAKARLGICYFDGYGIEKDYDKAFQLIKEECAHRGSQGPQYYLGLCYEEGLGTSKDPKKAYDCYNSVASSDKKSAYKLAQCYKNGFGTRTNLTYAISYLKGLADDDRNVRFELIDLYFNNSSSYKAVQEMKKILDSSSYANFLYAQCCQIGKDVDKSLRLAAQHYKKAFALASENESQGKADASDYYCLALCYENARGTSKDAEKALNYYKLAAKDNFGKAQEKVQELEK